MREISAPTLVALLIGARRIGDRETEQHARRLLADQHGIRLAFATTRARPHHAANREEAVRA